MSPLSEEMHVSWNYHLVTLSVVSAIFGSYVALAFTGRMQSAQGTARKLWFTGGACLMGLAIWTMHFVGMAALIMPMPLAYDEFLMILSILAAIIGSAIAFAIMSRPTLDRFHLIAGSIAMGLAISTMHYTGMASMRMAVRVEYNTFLFVLSVLVGILASASALWMTFRLHQGSQDGIVWRKISAAMLMGLAISGMHYTGMTAARYYPVTNQALGTDLAPSIGIFKLDDLLIAASILFVAMLLLLSAQIAMERQIALKIARDSERRFQSIFDQAAVGIGLVGLEGKWLRLNQKYCEILGYTADELLSMTFQEVTHRDDLASDLELYRQLKNSEIDHFIEEKRYIRKNGPTIWVRLTVSLVRDDRNRPLYAIAIAEDISEQKQADQALQKSLEREKLASEMIDSIRSEIDLDTILRQTINNVGRLIQADRCRIWLYNPESDEFLVPTHEYRSRENVVPVLETDAGDKALLPDLLARTDVINIPSLSQIESLTPQDEQIIRQRGLKSLLQVPISYKDQFLGVLRVNAVFEEQIWDMEAVDLVKQVAAQAAIAISHAKTLQEVRNLEARKSGILESSLDAIITIDHTGKVCEWNAAAERILGHSRRDAIGQELSRLIIPELYREAHHKGLIHYLESGEGPVLNKELELPALRADGSLFLSELSITRIPIDGPPMFTGTMRDITERKKAQEDLQQLTRELEQRVRDRTTQLEAVNKELRISEERFRLLVENVKDYAIFLLDPNGIIQTWNKGAERIKGYTSTEIIGQSFSKFYPLELIEQDYPAYELKMAREQGHFEDTGWRLRKDGSRFWANVLITALYDRNNQFIGFTKITRDLTQQKQAEEELMASEQRYRQLSEELQAQSTQLEAVNRELETFSYSVSHDLRAPLRGIDGFSQALLEQYGDKLDSQGKHFLMRVRQGSQQMGNLIDDMLQLSRLTRGEMNMEPVDLSEIARDISRDLQEQQPGRDARFIIAEHAFAQGDKRLLQAVLQNLFDNAWKYTSKHETARIEFGVMGHPDTPIYFVSDDGVGFDMRYADKLFGAFQRLHTLTEFPGTGVGLATVARIIHRHGGNVWAEAEIEQGATFYFTLGESVASDVNIASDTEEKQHASQFA